MFRRAVGSLFLSLLVFLGALQAQPSAREDHLLVRFKPEQIPAGDLRAHGQTVRRYPKIPGLELIALDGSASVEQALAEYRADPRVAYAQVDHAHRKEVDLIPNDPGTPEGDAWHLENDGRLLGKVHGDISARAAWAILHDAPSVVVAVLDTGIRYTHEDLVANMWKNSGEIAGNGIDDDGDDVIDDVFGFNAINGTGSVMDDDGHGTFVAGLIGAVGDNAKGVTGVCWKVQLMAVKVLDSTGRGYDSDIIAGMEYADQHGASIINASLGSLGTANPAMADAITMLRGDGVILVAAAGNESYDNDYDRNITAFPASFSSSNLVSVAASTRNDLLATFSNFGANRVHLAAPGIDLPSTSFDSDSSYETKSGTSMSAPLVSGALALMSAKFPGLTVPQLINQLLNTVDPIAGLSGKCLSAGRLNLEHALLGSGASAPVNQKVARALPLSGYQFSGSGVTLNAPESVGSLIKNLWWTWSAPYTGYLEIDLAQGIDPDSLVRPEFSVYVSTSAGFQYLDTSSGQSKFSLFVYAGEYFYFQLGNASGDSGGAASFRARYDFVPDGFGDYSLLSVNADGSGTVSPMGDSVRKVGAVVRLTAKPAPGYILYGWYDDSAEDPDDALLSRLPSFKYTVAENGFHSLRAIFIYSPFNQLKGRYNGLAINGAGTEAASLTLDLNGGGSFSGSLRVRGKVYPLKGILRGDLSFHFQKTIAGQTVTLDFELDDERRLTGSVEILGESAWDLVAESGDFDPEENPALAAGSYTLALPLAAPASGAPEGHGFGSLTVTPAGAIRFAGSLGDGRAVSQGANLYRIGLWAFYAQPYTGKESVFGLVHFDEDATTSDLAGTLNWVKPANSADSVYPGGFNAQIGLVGSRYQTPFNTTVIDLPAGANNAEFDFSAGGLAAPQNFALTFDSQNHFVLPAGLKLTLDLKRGLFSGSFLETATTNKRAFRGAFLQKTGEGIGLFTRKPKTGPVSFGPP